MKQSCLVIAFNFLLIATSAAVAESKQAENTIIVPEGSTDYKNGYLDGYMRGVKQANQEGLENHKQRLAKAEAKLQQAVEEARQNLSK